MYAPTILIFSRVPETLAEISDRLEKLGYHHTWVPINQWSGWINQLWNAAGVIVDTVDPEFSHHVALEELLAWLSQVGYLPTQMLILVSTDNYDWDHLAENDPRIKVHHFADALTDQELQALAQESQVSIDLVM